MLYRIAITGPESTGKSILAKALAKHFNGNVVDEYAREYIDQLGRPYKEGDLLEIAKGQIEKEDEVAKKADGYLFCDTELTVIDIWGQEKFGRSHTWINEQLEKRAYDLYLLCDIDLEWKPDPQRENPYDRVHLLDLYRQSLKERSIKYKLISGQGNERIRNAIKYISEHFGLESQQKHKEI